MNDIGKIALLAAILGAILLVGVIVQPVDRTEEIQEVAEQVTVEEPVVSEITVVADESLELLDPIYSEKAVFQDDALRIAFDTSHSEAGVESRIPFWLHNISSDVIQVVWDRCSLQLPNGNTVHIVNEENLSAFGPMGGSISIAPAGDLFDAIIPVPELSWTEDGSWNVTSDVLNQGIFTLVLAIERGCPDGGLQARAAVQPRATVQRCPVETGVCDAPAREITYYTFRFVVR